MRSGRAMPSVQKFEDDDIIVLGARVIGPELLYQLARGFPATRFWGEKLQHRRLQKVQALDAQPPAAKERRS